MNPKKRGTGQVHRESDAEREMAAQMTEQLEQQAGPGVYLCGQRLVATEAKAPDQMLLKFEGNWDLLITGVFQFKLVDNALVLPDPAKVSKEHDIEGEVVDEDMVDEGKRLMRGEQ